MRSPILAVALALLVAGPAMAAEKIDCSAPQATHDQLFCGEKDLEIADAALNKAYKQALARIAASVDQEKPYDAKSWEAALRTAQRAWVAFREADCKGDLPFLWTGGTATGPAVLSCLIDMTKARTRDLVDRYTEQ